MKSDPQRPTEKVELIAATPDQQPIIANLFQLYAYDFSEFHEVALGDDGRFGYTDLPLYWSEANRFPFLVKVDGKPAGFVLVKGSETAEDQTSWDMAEFFVLRSHRRRGIGAEIAQQVFRKFPGSWQVRVMEANQPGRRFWQRTIAGFTGKEAGSAHKQKDGNGWHYFLFDSSGS